MGLLGGIIKGIGKIAGKVVKTVASKATHGLSDVVLSKLKSRGAAKPVAAGKLTNSQQAALVNKIGLTVPRTINTVSVLEDAVDGGTYGTQRRATPVNKKKRAAGKPTLMDMTTTARKGTPAYKKAAAYAKKKGVRLVQLSSDADYREEPAPKAKKAKKAKKASSGTRTVPSGGLDLKAISALWNSQGKPGRWIDFIKANPIRKD